MSYSAGDSPTVLYEQQKGIKIGHENEEKQECSTDDAISCADQSSELVSQSFSTEDEEEEEEEYIPNNNMKKVRVKRAKRILRGDPGDSNNSAIPLKVNYRLILTLVKRKGWKESPFFSLREVDTKVSTCIYTILCVSVKIVTLHFHIFTYIAVHVTLLVIPCICIPCLFLDCP